MCGVPFHAVTGYIQRLVQKGYKVAIVEQMEDPALAKGLVKRDVIKVVTPGTVMSCLTNVPAFIWRLLWTISMDSLCRSVKCRPVKRQ